MLTIIEEQWETTFRFIYSKLRNLRKSRTLMDL